VFADAIATGSEKTQVLDAQKQAAIETALKRVSGVTAIRFSDRQVDIDYSGRYSDIDKLEQAFGAVPCEMVSPLKIVFRPSAIAADPEAALKAVSGVTRVLRSGPEFWCFGSIDVDLDALSKAAAKAGCLGSVESHQIVRVPAKRADAAKADLESLKHVLKVDVTDSEVRLLTLKGPALKPIVKSILAKHKIEIP
jgi:copper chaperone CopZ